MFRLLAIYFLVVNKIIITNAEIMPGVVAPSSGQAVNATTILGPEGDTYTPGVVAPSSGQAVNATTILGPEGDTYTPEVVAPSSGPEADTYTPEVVGNNIEAWKDAYNTFACLDRQDHPVAQILKSKWENANQC